MAKRVAGGCRCGRRHGCRREPPGERLKLVLAAAIAWIFASTSGCAHHGKDRGAANESSAATPAPADPASRWCDATQDNFAASIKLDEAIHAKTQSDRDRDDAFDRALDLTPSYPATAADVDRQKAEFDLARTLYCMKLFSASLTGFGRIVDRGPTDVTHEATLRWLVYLSHQVLDDDEILVKLGTYDRARLEHPLLADLRDELHYLFGKSIYTGKGVFTTPQFAGAVEVFNLIPAGSALYPRARLWIAELQVRQYQAAPAVAALKDVLRWCAARSDPAASRYRDLANLSLGRIFYSTGQYALAVKYYGRVRPWSPDGAESLFETAWATFMLGDDSKALAYIATFRSAVRTSTTPDQVAPAVQAEALLLTAAIAEREHNAEQGTEAIDEFNSLYPGVFGELGAQLERRLDDAAFFDLALKIRRGESRLSAPTAKAARASLANFPWLTKRIAYVDQLTRELAICDKAPAWWKGSNVGRSVVADLTFRRTEETNRGGEMSRRALTRLRDELAQQIKRVIHIDYELLELKGAGDPAESLQE